jgi:HSP20 family molecular chaperone IbpA
MPRDSNLWMWAQALDLLEQAERLNRRFFLPRPAGARPVWEPPVDIVECAEQFRITIVLPGVEPENIEVASVDGILVVSGLRPAPTSHDVTAIHRLEIPYGRFERQIPLPAGRFLVGEPSCENGCLTIVLYKAD